MCKELIRLLLEYSNSDPANLDDETPSFGGWGKHSTRHSARVRAERRRETETTTTTLKWRTKEPDEMVTDEKGNVIIRGTDGKDHTYVLT